MLNLCSALVPTLTCRVYIRNCICCTCPTHITIAQRSTFKANSVWCCARDRPARAISGVQNGQRFVSNTPKRFAMPSGRNVAFECTPEHNVCIPSANWTGARAKFAHMKWKVRVKRTLCAANGWTMQFGTHEDNARPRVCWVCVQWSVAGALRGSNHGGKVHSSESRCESRHKITWLCN